MLKYSPNPAKLALLLDRPLVGLSRGHLLASLSWRYILTFRVRKLLPLFPYFSDANHEFVQLFSRLHQR